MQLQVPTAPAPGPAGDPMEAFSRVEKIDASDDFIRQTVEDADLPADRKSVV